MRTRLMIIVILLLAMAVSQTAAQEDTTCGDAAINQQVDDLIVQYNAARADDAQWAAQGLQQALADLLAGCGMASTPQSGLWHLVWLGADTQQCPVEGVALNLVDRDLVLNADSASGTLIADDLYAWNPLNFELQDDGSYFARRNQSNGSDNVTYEYRMHMESAGVMSGSVNSFLPSANCYLMLNFELQLKDSDISCIAGTLNAANLREGPGTTFARAGTIAVGDAEAVTGQATGSDGFIWWQLGEGRWARSDVVKTGGSCAGVPEVSP